MHLCDTGIFFICPPLYHIYLALNRQRIHLTLNMSDPKVHSREGVLLADKIVCSL